MTEDQNYYRPVGFLFKVMIAGIDEKYAAGFQEVSGLDVKLETEDIIEGGENQFSRKLPKALQYSNLILKRGLVVGEPFINWIAEAVQHFKFQPKTVTVLLLDETGGPLVNWAFHNAYPVSVKVSDLSSTENNYAIESLELAYEFFGRVATENN